MPLTQVAVREKITQLTALSRQDYPVAIANTLPTITAFTDEVTGVSMTWQGAGDPSGRDIREVPPSMLLNPQFRETIMRGIFEMILDDGALEHSLFLQRQSWDNGVDYRANAAAMIDSASANVVAVGVSCIAPKNARELCGNLGVVMGKDPNEAPPLCAEHVKLAPMYQPSQTGREVNGKPEIVWKRA